MGGSNQQTAQVKKVKPYPFDGTLEYGGKKSAVQLKRITQVGFLADVGQLLLKVGDEAKVLAELPVVKSWVIATVKVIKTYDQFRDQKTNTGHVERMAEFHFVGISPDHKENVSKFISAIRQV